MYVCHRIFLANLKLTALKTKDQARMCAWVSITHLLTDRQQISLWATWVLGF